MNLYNLYYLIFFLFIISLAEIYIDSGYHHLDCDGSIDKPFNSVDALQQYFNFNTIQKIIVKSSFLIEGELTLTNMNINFRSLILFYFSEKN